MNRKLKFKLIRIGILGLVVGLLLVFNPVHLNLNQSTVRAVGDLEIDWGVPDGQPIFEIFNMMPGQSEERQVKVTNNGSSIRPVGVRGVEKPGGIGSLKDVLEITISQNGTDLYGGTTGTKTVSQFFTDSAGPDGIFLLNLNLSITKTLNFQVTLPTSAGNEFKNTSIIFDIIIGISVAVPAECQNIEFSGDPIFGTSKGDRIIGTSGNDLIFGFEGGDFIDGKNGDDCIIGGQGGDFLKGGNGNDVIFGNEGGDSLNGENGKDLLIGGEGSDSLKGGNGDDILNGNDGDDSLDGQNGNDSLDGGSGSDGLKGGRGDDSLLGGPGSDSADGQQGFDNCDAESERNCEI